MTLKRLDHYSGPGALWAENTHAPGAPVLITHGTFSNAQTCQPLASFMAAQNRPVYVIEWRGRAGRPGRFDFDDLATGEIRHALQYVLRPTHLLAHSGGGLAMILGLRDPTVRARALSLTTLATQATHLHCAPRRARLGISVWAGVGRVMGYWPASRLGLGPCNESAAILNHWLRFNAARAMIANDGTDVFAETRTWRLPMFSLGGAGDRVIAPTPGCKALAEAFGDTGRFHLCAHDTDGEDFSHSRLLRSRAAATHVWPRIAQFIKGHDTAKVA